MFKTIKEKNIKIVFLDTINPLSPNIDDNSAKDVTSLFNEFLKPLCDNLNCTVIFLHHTDKHGNKYLGSIKWKGNSDTVLKIDRKESSFEVLLKNEKNREGEYKTLKIGIDKQKNKTIFKLLNEIVPQASRVKRVTKSEELILTLNQLVGNRRDMPRAEIIQILRARNINFSKATFDRVLRCWRGG